MSDPFFDADRMSGDYPEKGHYKDKLIDELDARTEPAPQEHTKAQSDKRSGGTPVGAAPLPDAIAWMIECSTTFCGWWDGKSELRCVFFKSDPNLAKRFPTKESAEAIIKERGNSCMKATEHVWMSKSPVGAAPLPDDVAEMVKGMRWLKGIIQRDADRSGWEQESEGATSCGQAADMLEQQQARIAELEALTKAEYDERGRLWAIINAYERGDKVSPYAPTTIPEGMVLVPESAMRWLFGEEGEFECPPDRYFRGKEPRYWWRTVFREKIAAARKEEK